MLNKQSVGTKEDLFTKKGEFIYRIEENKYYIH